MQRAGSKAEPRGSCAGYGTQPSADRHPPPTTGGSGRPQTALHSTAAGQHRGKETEEQGILYFKGFRVQAASGEAEMSSQHSRLNRESETLASSELGPLRPPWSHRMWWLGEGMWAPSTYSWASPSAPAGHSYRPRRAACCPCCGGRCGLWEGWVPAFQDVGSVGIPAIRRRESGLLRTEHLSPWPRCLVSTLDLDRPENEVSV